MARVAIIMPAYNCANFILLTLHYALRQTFSDLEIVIVDDGSSDNLLEVLDRSDPRVRVISQAGQGPSVARNRAMRESDSEFIAFLDADDIWHPKKLAAQVKLLEHRREFDLCCGEFQVWNDRIPVSFAPELEPLDLVPEMTGWVYHRFVMTCAALLSTLFLRREVVQRMGPFLTEDRQTDDWEFMVRASRQFRFAKLRPVVTLYRQHPNQLSKRLPASDVTAELREDMLRRYGMTGPDGTPVDPVELERRRYAAHLAFASAHLATGSLATGVAYARRAWTLRPLDPKSYLLVPKGVARRLLPKPGLAPAPGA